MKNMVVTVILAYLLNTIISSVFFFITLDLTLLEYL